MASKKVFRKRSVTLNSLDPLFRQERLRTSSINSLASGIAFLSTASRPRSFTWHGEVESNTSKGIPEISGDFSNNTEEKIADLQEFDHDFQTHELLRQIVSEELENQLADQNHDKKNCVKQAAAISQAVEDRVKRITNSDTKVVAVVYIGEIRDQGIEITSQCLWNPDTDSFATASFRNHSLFAVCTVFTVS